MAARPLRSRRSEPTATLSASAPASSRAPLTPMTRAGWGLSSTNVLNPCSAWARTVRANSTVLRRLRHQYSAPSSVPRSSSPVTEERKGTLSGRGARVARSRIMRSVIESMCAE